jgi:hypothetical protein
MNLMALAVFASPVFVNTGRAAAGILIGVTLFPAFALRALTGTHILLGIFQMITLFAAEVVQWRFTRLARVPIKLIGAVMTYCVANLLFFLGVFFLLAHNWIRISN